MNVFLFLITAFLPDCFFKNLWEADKVFPKCPYSNCHVHIVNDYANTVRSQQFYADAERELNIHRERADLWNKEQDEIWRPPREDAEIIYE